MKSLSHVWPLVTPWTTAHQAPPSMGFSRQEYWSGVLRYNSQTIQFTHFKYITSGFRYIHNISQLSPWYNFRIFVWFPKAAMYLLGITSHPESSLPGQPKATTNFLSLWMNLLFLDISFTWCRLLCLTSFTYQNVFKVHPRCSMDQYSIPFFFFFNIWIIFYCWIFLVLSYTMLIQEVQSCALIMI